MRSLLLTLAALALGGAAVAQTDHTLVIPLGAGPVEGDTSDTRLLNLPYLRYQQIDRDTVGNPHLIKWIQLRRDGLASTPSAQNRTIDMEVVLGAGLMSAFSTKFSDNIFFGSSTTSFFRKPVSLPNWSQTPPTPPASFNLTLLQDVFYAHPGVASLVFQFQVWDRGSGLGSYAADAVTANGIANSTSTAVGVGCTTPNGAFAHTANFQITGFGSACSLAMGVTNAPSMAAVTALLGSSDPNLALGFCANLRTDALVSIPLGASNAAGTANATFPIGAYVDAWGGAQLFSQAYAFDATQPVVPVALSSGIRFLIPRRPYDVRHTFSTNPASPDGVSVNQGGLIIQIADTPPP